MLKSFELHDMVKKKYKPCIIKRKLTVYENKNFRCLMNFDILLHDNFPLNE